MLVVNASPQRGWLYQVAMATLWVERVLVPRVAHYLLHRYLRGVHGRVELANVPTLDDQQGTLPQCVMWRL